MNQLDGAPGGIRTPDQSVRSRLLYPAELRAPAPSLAESAAPVASAVPCACARRCGHLELRKTRHEKSALRFQLRRCKRGSTSLHGFAAAVETRKQMTSGSMQQMVVGRGAARRERIDQTERTLGSVNHRHGDRVVELDHRCRVQPQQYSYRPTVCRQSVASFPETLACNAAMAAGEDRLPAHEIRPQIRGRVPRRLDLLPRARDLLSSAYYPATPLAG
jgi:hypothetical protein